MEVPVSSHLSLWRSGTLSAQGKVAKISSCGVQQRKITMKQRSGAFVPLKVRSFQPFHIYNNKHSFCEELTEEFSALFIKPCRIVFVCLSFLQLLSLKRSVLTGLVSDPPFSPPSRTTLPLPLLSCQHSTVLVFLFSQARLSPDTALKLGKQAHFYYTQSSMFLSRQNESTSYFFQFLFSLKSIQDNRCYSTFTS